MLSLLMSYAVILYLVVYIHDVNMKWWLVIEICNQRIMFPWFALLAHLFNCHFVAFEITGHLNDGISYFFLSLLFWFLFKTLAMTSYPSAVIINRQFQTSKRFRAGNIVENTYFRDLYRPTAGVGCLSKPCFNQGRYSERAWKCWSW